MQVYTLNSGTIEAGATVSRFSLKSADITIPVIGVGEYGRGREYDFVAVSLLPENYITFMEGKEKVHIYYANLTSTKSGRNKLAETLYDETPSDGFIAVMPTMIGFRGSNEHTGDIKEIVDGKTKYYDFPGEVLAMGIIAQGAAGYAGSGSQLIAKVPYCTWFATKYYGRLYGNPDRHWYYHDGEKLLCFTDEEREVYEDII